MFLILLMGVFLFVIRYSLFVIRYSLFVIRYSLFVIRYSLFVIRYSLFVIRYSLFVIRYSCLSAGGCYLLFLLIMASKIGTRVSTPSSRGSTVGIPSCCS